MFAIGDSAYLSRKGVQAHGVRFSGRGNLVIPMCDAGGSVHGLQVIYGTKKNGRDKDFWPAGLAKQGHFFLCGPSPSGGVLLIVIAVPSVLIFVREPSEAAAGGDPEALPGFEFAGNVMLMADGRALVVDPATGTVLASRHNERELTGDPTAHAEVIAIRAAAVIRHAERYVVKRRGRSHDSHIEDERIPRRRR